MSSLKIYSKKGFVAGLLWTAAGVFCLYQDAVDASDFLPQQIKSVVLSLVMLAAGLTCLARALSKSASREDKIEALDERSRLVRLKTNSLTLRVMGWARVAAMLAGLLGYLCTENLVFGCLFLFGGLSLALEAVVAIAAAVHYETHM